jgi:GGDEF domain-containing protein
MDAPEPLLEEVDLEEVATDPGEPGTLINPVTNLSFRDHLERRLGLELERAAYNDQDLTCMLVSFTDAADGGEAYSRRSGQILSAFKFEDLCFEYGKDAFCVILPNTELSRGIREAESFKGDHAGTMYFGLSARNGRLVESSRVLGEAERSLEHAQREPGGIVGFRPDPRKYRQFVTQHLGPNG